MSNELTQSPDKLTFTCERFDGIIYQDVSRKARLREVRLAGSEYNAKVMDFFGADKSQAEDLKQSFKGASGDITFSADYGVVAGIYQWSAEVKVGRQRLLKCSANYLVLYNGVKECPEDYVKLYFEKLARFTTYPYFRALFSGNVSSSGLMLAPLPSLTERVD